MSQDPSRSPDELPDAAEPSALPSEPFTLTLPDDPSAQKEWYLWAAVLAILVCLAFLPARGAGFIWDDNAYVTASLVMESGRNLLHAWVPPIVTPQYYPLTHTVLYLEHAAWGDAAVAYHIVNLLLQAGAAVVAWRVLRRLGVPGAWAAAALWAIHPIQAESVVWVSEIKNLLSGVLFFASAYFFLDYADVDAEPSLDPSSPPPFKMPHPAAAYAVSLGLFVLALLAKTTVVALPPALLIVLWWKRRLDGRRAVALVPFFAVGLALSVVTVLREQSLTTGFANDWNLTLLQRFELAGRNFWFYLAKLFVPAGLTFSYPKIEPQPWHLLLFAAAAALVAGLWAAQQRIGRGPAAAVMYYAVALFPALGFFDVFPFRYSYVADHFQYLAGLGIVALVVGAVTRAITGRPAHAADARPAAAVAVADDGAAAARRPIPFFPVALTVAALVALGGVAYVHAGTFEDSITLWRDVLSKNDSSWMANDNLAAALVEEAHDAAGLAETARAAGDADSVDAALKVRHDDLVEALQHYDASLKLRPGNYRAHTGKAVAYARLGDVQAAEAEYRQAIDGAAADPASRPEAAPYVGLAQLYIDQGQRLDGQARNAVAVRAMGAVGDPAPTTGPATRASVGDLAPAAVQTAASAFGSAPGGAATQALAATRPAPTTQAFASSAAFATTDPATSALRAQAAAYYEKAVDAAARGAELAAAGLASPRTFVASREQLGLALFRQGLAQYHLAVSRADAGDRAAAEAMSRAARANLDEAFRRRPDDPDVNYWLGMSYLRNAAADPTAESNAEAFLLRAIQDAPGKHYPLAYYQMGLIRAAHASPARLDLLEAAMGAFDEAYKTNPSLTVAKDALDRATALHDEWSKLAATRPSSGATGDALAPPEGASK